MVELVIRLVFSLAVVLGMLMLLTRFSAKRFRGGSDALVRVVHRQALSRTSAVAVVTVGSRVLVVGTTEHQVQLLTELDPEELELPADVSFEAPLEESFEESFEESPVLAPDPGFEAGFDAGFEVGCEVAGPALSEFTSLDELLGPTETQSNEPPEDPTNAPSDISSDEQLELVDSAYSPRHAASTASATRTARPTAAARTRSFTGSARVAGDGPLAGSLLSAQTWKQAFAVATSRNRNAS
jgi:flagellar protein FliO/FliZ